MLSATNHQQIRSELLRSSIYHAGNLAASDQKLATNSRLAGLRPESFTCVSNQVPAQLAVQELLRDGIRAWNNMREGEFGAVFLRKLHARGNDRLAPR